MSAISNPTSNIALTIVGMHRSGTSALAGLLTLLGAQAPKTLFTDHWNAKGHFESIPIIEVNNSILAEAGLGVEDWSQMPVAWPPEGLRRDFTGRLAKAIVSEFDAELIVLKDPRVSRFVELTAGAVEQAGWQPRFILIYRNPLEVAQSMARRNGLPIDHNLLIWLRYVLDAEKDTRKYPRVIVSYEKLTQDWRGCIAQIEQGIGVTLLNQSSDLEKADEFIESELRHFRLEGGVPAGNLSDWLEKVLASYEALQLSSNNQDAMNALDQLEDEFSCSTKRFQSLPLGFSKHSTASTGATEQQNHMILRALEAVEKSAERHLSRTLAAVDAQLKTLSLEIEGKLEGQKQTNELFNQILKLKDKVAAQEQSFNACMERARSAEAAYHELKVETSLSSSKIKQLLQKLQNRDNEAEQNSRDLATIKLEHEKIEKEILKLHQGYLWATRSAMPTAAMLVAKPRLFKLIFRSAEKRRFAVKQELTALLPGEVIPEGLVNKLARRRALIGLLRRPYRSALSIIFTELLLLKPELPKT